MRGWVVFILLLAAATGAAAEIYTWRDSSGRVHYSDTPPPRAQDARTLRGSPASPPPPPAPAQTTSTAKPGTPSTTEPKTIQEQELEFRKRRAQAADEQAKKDKELAMAEEKRRNCEQARAQLAALESGQRIVRFNPQGEREYLEDDQRAVEVERLRKSVSELCG